MNRKKKRIQFLLFLGIMVLTFYTVLRGQDFTKIIKAVLGMTPGYLLCAMALGIFFVSLEGIMIWYLLSALGGKSGVGRCIVYSFIGFFYSGITPSATGGQPMQLYYMKKDGNETSECSVVLMTVALAYKAVLVLIGVVVLLFWYQPLKSYFKGYFYLFLLGIVLNTAVVLAIWGLMVFPGLLTRLLGGCARVLEQVHILKKKPGRGEEIRLFVESYGDAVDFIRGHKKKLAVVSVLTFLQRFCVFLLTYVVYRGFGLHVAGGGTVMLLQAAVYLTVDMLPIPGAQGITELVYRTVFAEIFTGTYLIPSMLVSRGMNFYVPLAVSAAVVAAMFCIHAGRPADRRQIK